MSSESEKPNQDGNDGDSESAVGADRAAGPVASAKGFDGVFDYVGGGHLFQWLLMAAVSLQGSVLVNHHLGFVFLGAIPDHWCAVDVGELNGTTWTPDQIKNISIPWKTLPNGNGNTTSREWDRCNMYDIDYGALVRKYRSFDEAYESINFTATETRKCTQWNYDKSIYESTVVTQFDLVCDRRSLVASIQASYMGGVLLGSLLLGSLSDKLLGRRKAILVAVTLTMVSGLAAAFAESFMAFSIFRFLVAAGVSGSYQNCFVLLLEYSDKSYRSLLGIIQQMPFAIGYMTIPLYAYYIRRWDHLQLAFAITTFVLVLYFWILPESARWLASKERDDEAIQRLHSVAKWNGRALPSKEVLLPMLKTCREEQSASTKKGFWPRLWENTCLTISNYFILVKSRELRRRSFCIWTLFTCVALVYYGVVFDSASLTKDPFMIVFLGGLMEVPAYTLSQPLVAKWGRRPTLILLFALTGIVFFAFVATPKDLETIRIFFSMSGKLFISSAFAVIYLLGAELYPTSARITGLGSAVIMGRFGSILAPYVVAGLQSTYRDLPTAIFGVAALIGAVVSCFLPETKDLEMTDVVAEVEESAHIDLPSINFPIGKAATSNQPAKSIPDKS